FRGLTIKEGGYAVFKAESIKASLALIPLIFHKEFEVKNLVITGTDVFVKREAGGGFNIIRILKETYIPVSIKKVRIKTGKAHFTDEFLQGGIKYEAVNIDAMLIPKGADDFSYYGTAKLLPSTRIKFSGETRNGAKDFEGKADIKEFEIERSWPYLSGIIPGETWEGGIDISINYQITGQSVSIKGNAAYSNKLTASIPSLFDKPVSSSQGVFDIEVESNSDVLTVSIPKAQVYFPDFIAFANLKLESRKKNNNDRLVLNLNTTRIPLVSIKEQFFTSILPDSFKKEMNLTSFRRGQIKISNLQLAGNVMDIKRLDYYKTPGSLLAAVEISDAEFTHKDFSRVFSMIDGSIKWKDGNLNVYGVSGKYGKTVVEKLEGGINLLVDAPLAQLNGYCMVDTGEAADELKKRLGKSSPFIPLWRGTGGGFAANGIVPLSFRLSDALNDETGKGLALSISTDATSADMSYLSWIKKEKGFAAAIAADLLVRRDNISIEAAKINFGKSWFTVKGLLNFNSSDLSYQLNITAPNIRLDDIDMIVPYLKREFPSKGSLSASLDLDKKEMQKTPEIRGSLFLRNGEFETRFLPKRVYDANLTSSFYGTSAAITVDSIKTGSSILSGSIDIPDTKTANIDFNLNSPYLNDEDFYNRETAMEAVTMPFIGKGKIAAKQAKVMGFDIESLQTDALLKSDAILLKAKFASNNGNVVSNFIYSGGDSEDASLWRLNVNASNVEIEPLLKQAGAEEKTLTGDADIKIELSARRGTETLSKRIDGKGEVYSKNGRLWKFVVLSKIFSIVNIISIDELFRDGLPYKSVAGNFMVKNGVISTDNLLLDSNSMRMSAIGIIDTTNMTIDAKLGLHPFVSVDKIITNIPLAGWIIGGKEKSVVSMYYEIKGPLKNPEVEAIPIKALGEGVWGIFKRTLKLPLDIVEPLVK
ncbi:MAG: AsmA-like C-terminal domain-containing protein, partial [Deltaproteobacteria bacterium]|nr:AsmA-like C-terminal domain-containing protein [Deltaproteobacteria bacterium]